MAVSSAPPFRTLLVEDDDGSRAYLREVLAMRGHDVVAVADGDAAWREASRAAPDLMVVDWFLPRVSGDELCRRVRGAAPPLSRTVIVVATASRERGILQAALDAGADDFLTKPIEVTLLDLRLAVAEARARDRGRREVAESEAKSSRELVTSVIDTVDDGYYEVDLAGNFTVANRALAEILGRSPSELHGMNDREYTDEENAKTAFLAFNEVYRTGRPIRQLEWEVLHRDGSRRVLEVSASLRRDDRGLAIGFRGMVRDVTERRRLERALADSERRLVAARASNDGLWDWDLVSGVIEYSPRWKAMLELPSDAGCGRPNDWMERVHPDDVENLRQDLSRHLAGETLHVENEHRMRTGGEAYRWMQVRATAVRDERGRAIRLVGTQIDIEARKQAEEKLRHEALHDPLTGLANRALFFEHLQRALQRMRRHAEDGFAVLFVDLDGLKPVNDKSGHAIGDRLLAEVARRLQHAVRALDSVARIGGDEFVVLIERVLAPVDAERVAERIRHDLAQPHRIGDEELRVSASIGIALARENDVPDGLVRRADQAMYAAKARGGDRYEPAASASA